MQKTILQLEHERAERMPRERTPRRKLGQGERRLSGANRFKLGVVYMSKGVAERAATERGLSSRLLDCLRRHAAGDWGEMSEQDQAANRIALRSGRRLLSGYKLDDSLPYEGANRLWIITEGLRTHTTLLLTDEY